MSKLNLIDLSSFRESCDVFFETGSCFGEGVDYAIRFNFNKIFSVEIEDKKIPFLKDKYKNNNNVEIIHSTSLLSFEDKLPNVDANIVFWLDAHYPDLIYREYADPSSDRYERDIRLPLEQELIALKRHRSLFKDIIIFDDIDCFINDGEKMPNWLKPKVNFTKDFYKKIFSDSHNFIQINVENKIGILFPK